MNIKTSALIGRFIVTLIQHKENMSKVEVARALAQACKDAGLRFPEIDLDGKTLLVPIDLEEVQHDSTK